MREPTERALLDAIVASPDDDDLRLVYADALEARGEPLGELIQIQCRLARPPAPANSAVLEARAAVLLRANERRWLAGLHGLAPGAEFGFHRGFVASMHAHYSAATRRAEALVELAPLLSRFELTVHGQLKRVELARPRSVTALVRARELSIRGRHAGATRDARGPIADLRQLAELPFARLRELRLARLRTRPRQLADLVRSPHLQALESLALELRMPNAEVEAIAASIPRDSLRALDVSGNALGATGLAALLSVPLPALHRLVLSSTAMNDPEVRMLAGWTGAPQLAELDLGATRVSDTAIRAMQEAHPGLRVRVRDPYSHA